MTSCVVVFVTCPSVAAGRRLGRELVKRRLAACVNIVPGVESIFWWQNKVDRARETLLMVKTSGAQFEALRRSVIEVHPYKVPEVIAVPIQFGHRPYLRWVTSSVAER